MRILAHAKVNLTLEVLNRRADGFHNLRTVFQTISLADVLEVTAERAKSTKVSVQSDVEIPGENLITRAAHGLLEAAGVRATVSCRLKKRIPLGAGLGGGSADAAAMLRALSALLHLKVGRERLAEIAASLGSDVPFLLMGGTALGLGRGTELYPLPDLPAFPLLVIATGLHVSTADAYRLLSRTESSMREKNATERFAQEMLTGSWHEHCVNDFEQSVFAAHPGLARLRRKIARTGARAARMTGSGSALFGVYDSRAARDASAVQFSSQQVFKCAFLRRSRVAMLTSGLSAARKGA